MIAGRWRTMAPRLASGWDRASLRERRMIAMAALIITGAVAWTWGWQPLLLDRDRLERDQLRAQNVLATARLQAAAIATLDRAGPAIRPADLRTAVERTLAERGLRIAAPTLDVQDARIRLTFASISIEGLVNMLDQLATTEGVRPVELSITPRIEPGTVRAEMWLAR